MIASRTGPGPTGVRVSSILLAGTHVWQANSFEALCPRALLPVANAPLLSYSLRTLNSAGIRTATICANDATTDLQDWLRDGAAYGVDLYYYQDRLPRGPAGCAGDVARYQVSDHYVVLDGSLVPTLDLAAIVETHISSGAAATVVVNEVPADGPRFEPLLVPTGAYVFSAAALAQVRPTGYQDLKEVLIPQLFATGAEVRTVTSRTHVPRVYGLASYLQAQDWGLRQRHAELEGADYRADGAALVHESARIARSARVLGSVLIGPACEIADDVVIAGPCVLGGGCSVAQRSALSGSVLWDHASVASGATVDQCLVTSHAVVPQGARQHGATIVATARERSALARQHSLQSGQKAAAAR